ncbi:conserved Plasmodium protein, unknown function [Plasmodium ovale wallikeri]|uniref:WD repeat-containing protein n=1 Tax=Plasmodium ovale wallikeri TaxID=864142 RepID=A0A1A8ZZP5_PLAOA|nr:conserved Plasmodium protein, unknown function [Plasmodium ovale wallikeri]SBT49412.1 conserved Plasmodium protein, unknown function [Plasmodium ovale wallikeri]
MNHPFLEDTDFVIDDAFFSNNDESEGESEEEEKKRISNSNSKKNVRGNENYEFEDALEDELENNYSNNYKKTRKISWKGKQNHHANNQNGNFDREVYSNNETGGYCNFENYLHDVSDLNNGDTVSERYNKRRRNGEVRTKPNRVWRDSDDEDLEDTSKKGRATVNKPYGDNEENKITDDDYFSPREDVHEYAELGPHEKEKDYIETEIENVSIEMFESENQGEVDYKGEDIFIFDDIAINDVLYKGKRSKRVENSIYLKYHLSFFHLNEIKEQKIKQMVTLPMNNLIIPSYDKCMYVLKYQDKELKILKKLSLKKHIKYVEEHDENLYILIVVYKSRIHNQEKKFRLMTIRFFDMLGDSKRNNTSGSGSLSNLFSLSHFDSGRINVYDKRSYDIVKTYNMDHNYVGMNFHQRTNTLYAIDKSGYVYNWCLNTNKMISRVMDNYSIFPSVLNVYNDYLVTGTNNGFLNLYDINNRTKPIKSFKNLVHRVKNAYFSTSNNYLLYYTTLLKNGVRLIDLESNYIYCNIPWFNSPLKHDVLGANFFNNGNNMCLVVKSNAFYVYDIWGRPKQSEL